LPTIFEISGLSNAPFFLVWCNFYPTKSDCPWIFFKFIGCLEFPPLEFFFKYFIIHYSNYLGKYLTEWSWKLSW
jgi:hypothetical protein